MMNITKNLKKYNDSTIYRKILRSLERELRRPYRLLLILIVLYFLVKSVYLAINIKLGVAPDETYHYKLIQIFSSDILIPENSPETYRYGPLNDKPYLFYVLLSHLSKFNIFKIDDYIYLRLINIFFGVGTILFTYKIAGEIHKNKYFQIFVALVASNLLMFTFLSSSINYDNLLILLSSASIYFLFNYIQRKKLSQLLLFIIFSGLAALTKFTFLPVGLLLLLILIANIFIDGPIKIIDNHINEIKKKKILYVILFSISIITIALVMEIYLLNVINHRQLLPSCTKILTHEQCMQNAIYARSTTINNPISDPINPISYFQEWILRMTASTSGILAHKNMLKTNREIFPYVSILVFSTTLYIRYLNVNRKTKNIIYSLFVVISFSLVLAFYQNYKTYLNTGNIGLALQGRYIFPVYPLLITTLIYPLFKYIESNKLKFIVLTLVASIFIHGDMIYFLKNVTEAWFN